MAFGRGLAPTQRRVFWNTLIISPACNPLRFERQAGPRLFPHLRDTANQRHFSRHRAIPAVRHVGGVGRAA
jgi:hypothetical protein